MRRRSPFILAAGAVVALWLMQSLGLLPWWSWTTRLGSLIIRPVYQLTAGLAQWGTGVWHSRKLTEDNNYWRTQAEYWQQQVKQASEQTRQCDQLSSLLKFNQQTEYQTVAVKLLGHGAASDLATRIIDHGSADGLAAGQPVVSPAGSLIGVVSRVWSSGAEVRLLDSPQSRLAVTAFNKTFSGGILIGTYQLGLMLTQVQPDDNLAVGDLIGTSGLQPGLPRGLLAGTVKEVWHQEGELFVSATIEPTVDWQYLTEAGVIINYFP